MSLFTYANILWIFDVLLLFSWDFSLSFSGSSVSPIVKENFHASTEIASWLEEFFLLFESEGKIFFTQAFFTILFESEMERGTASLPSRWKILKALWILNIYKIISSCGFLRKFLNFSLEKSNSVKSFDFHLQSR